MSKTRGFALFLFLFFAVASCTGCEGIDLVVMVDTSESMFAHFQDLEDYLIRDLLMHRLHRGDTFHLLSFADKPELEISAKIGVEADLEKVLGRILLLVPLGGYTDLVAAVQFLLSYTQSLPAENKKLILLLTDGIHDPPPGSPNRMKAEQLRETLLANAREIKRQGWSVHILQMPSSPEASSREGARLLGDYAGELGISVLPYREERKQSLYAEASGFPSLSFPAPLGRVGRRPRTVFSVENFSPRPIRFKVLEVRSDRGNLLPKGVSVSAEAGERKAFTLTLRLPAAFAPGAYQLPVRLLVDDENLRLSPLQGTLDFTLQETAWLIALKTPWLPVLLAALAAMLLAFFLIRLALYLRDLLQEALFPDYLRPAPLFSSRPFQRPIVMRVESQNPQIGFRNVHRIPRGSTRSVGGHGSTFLIYYLPMPRRIGAIRYDGKQYRFIPVKREFFPALFSPLDDCLNREIVALSKRGHRVALLFREYVSPLEELNRLMRSVKPAKASPAPSRPAASPRAGDPGRKGL